MIVRKVKRMKKQNEKNDKLTLRKIFNSPIGIILALVLIVIGILFYNRYLVNVTNLYTFSGFSEDFSIMNGTIYTSYDINYFGDSKIIYTGDEKEVHDFKVGFYIKKGNEYWTITEIESMKGTEDINVSFIDLVTSTDLSFTEPHRKAEKLSKENVKMIDNLVYRITGKDKDDKDVDIEIPIDVVKVSK